MISIIVRNKNEAEFIGFTLQSCLDFFGTPEIIVVDNNSTDDSLDVVQNFNNRTNIIIKNNNRYMPGEAINKGVKFATNDYILFLSGHAQIINLNFESILQVL